MPPPNITPATAINITSLPYSIIADAGGVPDGGLACDPAGAFQSLWWKYTATGYPQLISIAGGVGTSLYNPSLTVWTETSPGIFTMYSVQDTDYCTKDMTGNFWVPLPLIPGITFYFQVSNGNEIHTDPAPLYFQVIEAPNASITAGTAVITSDFDGFPASFTSITTGEFLGFRALPAGEFADTMPNGKVLLQYGADNNAVALYDTAITHDGDFTLVGFQALPGDFISGFPDSYLDGIWSDRLNYFYVKTHSQFYGTETLYQIESSTCALVGTGTINLVNNIGCGAVSRDGTRFYGGRIASAFGTLEIDVYNLTTHALITTWTISDPDYYLEGTQSQGFALADGTIIFPTERATLPAAPKFIRIDTTTGTIIQTYPNLGTGGMVIRASCYVNEGEFLAWMNEHFESDNAFLQVIKISDSSLIAEFPLLLAGQNGNPAGNIPFSAALSCPLFAMPVDVHPLGPKNTVIKISQLPIEIAVRVLTGKGKLTIIKESSPSSGTKAFSFTTSGGLIPPTFDLSMGQSRTYSNLTPDVYSVVEVSDLDWEAEYLLNTGGTDNLNINVPANSDVVLTVTNKLRNDPSGIYYINPNKPTRRDKYYTEEKKIPNPTIKTALLGE